MKGNHDKACSVFCLFGTLGIFAFAMVKTSDSKLNDEIRQLKIERKDLLKERLSYIEKREQFGASDESVWEAYEARIELKEAELELAVNGAERIKILEANVELFKKVEEKRKRRLKIDRPDNYLKAKADRLKAEIDLLVEKNKQMIR